MSGQSKCECRQLGQSYHLGHGHHVCWHNSLYYQCQDLMQEWAYDKNIGVNPVLVPRAGKTVYWWRCKFGHEWQVSPNKRTMCNSGCPYCSNKRVCLDNCLATTHPCSIDEWHSDNDFKPYDVTAGSERIVKWKCLKDECHVWESPICFRTENYYSECSFCCGRRALS